MSASEREIRRFGPFELDLGAAEVRQNGRRVKLQPQPFKLLVFLTSRPGNLITREEIRSTLWPEGTFVDFDQSVNFAVKQIRDAFGDSASQPIYLETVPRQGYRFVAPVETTVSPAAGPAARTAAAAPPIASNTVRLQKAMWANIAELRVAETRHRKQIRLLIAALVVVLAGLALYIVLR
jgi:DNA-binding winged helix-turn-helix (wHTH) protein